MKKKMKFKKRYLILIIPSICFLLFYLWVEYQQSTREIVDINDISNVQVAIEDGQNPAQANVSGEIKLKKFERISTVSAEQRDGIVYIYLTKTKGFSDDNTFHTSLNNILVSHDSAVPSEIAIVSGNEIIVKNEQDPTQNYMNVNNYDESKTIWNN